MVAHALYMHSTVGLPWVKTPQHSSATDLLSSLKCMQLSLHAKAIVGPLLAMLSEPLTAWRWLTSPVGYSDIPNLATQPRLRLCHSTMPQLRCKQHVAQCTFKQTVQPWLATWTPSLPFGFGQAFLWYRVCHSMLDRVFHKMLGTHLFVICLMFGSQLFIQHQGAKEALSQHAHQQDKQVFTAHSTRQPCGNPCA